MTAPLDRELFDAAALDSALAAGDAAAVFRDALRRAREVIRRRWLEGHAATELVPLHARVVDEFIVRAWRRHFPDPVAAGLALVAVGGYGRGELHPASDVDIMILSRRAPEEHGEALQAFLTFLWDMGLDTGHSVRTVDECVAEAARDITVATNIQEARLLDGDTDLFARQQAACGPEHLWPSRDFFAAKWEEQKRRHAKFNDTAYNLEPNVKEGPGGLRDIQVIGWVTRRHFGAGQLHELVTHGFLTETEFRSLAEGQAFLWQVRFGLHVFTGRREDRLLFDQQRRLAAHFGYRDTPQHLAVEQFMKQYYRTVMELSRLNEMLLQLFQEEILYAGDTAAPVEINRRFQSRHGFLEVRDPGVFRRYPFALLEVFLLMAQRPELKGVRANTIRLIRDHRYLIDPDFRASLACRSLFMELLRQREGVTHELRRMNRYGVLAAYLPEFGHIVGQMQHDLFHVYTVDEHTLFVVRNLRRFTVAEHAHEFPLCSQIIQRIPKQELLIIAALYHDIAKGRGGDHSELGAEDARAFCQRHDLPAYDTNLVVWLVRHHLLMSTTAQRRDLSDPEVINAFARQVGDVTHLEYLYLLTVADIRATNPELWNAWRDALLRELYIKTRRALRRGLHNPEIASEAAAKTRAEALERLAAADLATTDIEALWETLGEDYFLRCEPGEIAWHTEAILTRPAADDYLVLLDEHGTRGGNDIVIYGPDRDELFALLAQALDQLGLNVVDARVINTRDGHVLDTFRVLDAGNQPVAGARRLQEIRDHLRRRLAEGRLVEPAGEPHLPRQRRHFRFPAQLGFGPDPGGQARTMMELVALDRPGLLSRVGLALAHCRVRVVKAKIATYGERAEDIFFVTGAGGGPLDEKEQACLRREVARLLDEDVEPLQQAVT